MKKYIAELFGTFVLVFIGCGTVVFSAPYVGNVGIALAFGLALMAMAYAVGPVSGAHVNPAVTLGVLTAGRMSFKDALFYIIFQFVGATIGAYAIYAIAKGHLTGFNMSVVGLGQNGYGLGYASGYNIYSAALFEFIATFIFVKVILKATECDLKIAGVVIGLTLTVIHILGLQITGVSVNPARSFGPAVLVQGVALQQLWLFIVAPTLGGILAGIMSRCCCCCCQCKEETKKEAPVAQQKSVEVKKSSTSHAKRTPAARRQASTRRTK